MTRKVLTLTIDQQHKKVKIGENPIYPGAVGVTDWFFRNGHPESIHSSTLILHA